MTDLEEMEMTAAKVVTVPDAEYPEVGEEEDLLLQDILDAMSLLNKCMRLLDYMSDADLCKTITKRERENMSRLSEQVKAYLDEVEGNYQGEETD